MSMDILTTTNMTAPNVLEMVVPSSSGQNTDNFQVSTEPAENDSFILAVEEYKGTDNQSSSPSEVPSDNNIENDANTYINEQPSNEKYNLDRTEADEPTKKAQEKEKPVDKTLSDLFRQNRAGLAMLESAQHSVIITVGKKGSAAKAVFEPKNSENIAQLVKAGKQGQSYQISESSIKVAVKDRISEIPQEQHVLKEPLVEPVKGKLNAVATSLDSNTPVQPKSADRVGLNKATRKAENTDTEIISASQNAQKTTLKGGKVVTGPEQSVTGTHKTVVSEIVKQPDLAAVQNKEGKVVTGPEQSVTGTHKTVISEIVKQPDLAAVQNESVNVKTESRIVHNSSENPQLVNQQPENEKAGLSQQNQMSSKMLGRQVSTLSLVDKLNQTQSQMTQTQTNSRSGSDSKSNFNSSIEQILSHNNEQTFDVENLTDSSKNVGADNSTLLNAASAKLGAQIQESIRSTLSDSRHQITIQLEPPELGKVLIKFQQQDGQLTGLMQVSKEQTRYEIQQQLPQIIQNLADSGIQIKRFEVTHTDQQQQQAFREQTMQDGNLLHDDSAPQQSNTNGDLTKQGDWIENNETGLNGFTETEQTFVSEGSIDVLV